jgi:hypothetical protein
MQLKRIAQWMLPGCLFTLILFRFGSAAAGIIQMETQTSVTVTDSIVEVRVTATNKGNEPARNVHVHLTVFGKSCGRKAKDLLRQGESVSVLFRKIPTHENYGTYPLITRITFQDINRHPFSAVSCSAVSIGKSANSEVECLGKDTSISRNGLLRFTITNSGSEPRTTSATLVLPEELSTPIPRRELAVEPGKDEVLLFEISNFSALVGAVYPVFCYLEYNLGDIHCTEVGNGSVKIVKKDNWFSRTKTVWLGLAILTGVILAACQVKRKSL